MVSVEGAYCAGEGEPSVDGASERSRLSLGRGGRRVKDKEGKQRAFLVAT